MFKKRFYFILPVLVVLTSLGAGCLNTQQETNDNGQVKGEATTEIVAEIRVDLVINTGENKENYSITAKEGFTVLDVLQLASDEHGLDLETKDSSFGLFVQGLAGKSGGDDGKYWMYYVNGEAATVGAGDYKIKDGDSIEFRFE